MFCNKGSKRPSIAHQKEWMPFWLKASTVIEMAISIHSHEDKYAKGGDDYVDNHVDDGGDTDGERKKGIKKGRRTIMLTNVMTMTKM
jgi:hypothetical protein